ncbi:protein-methionine-sulfoxide reductase heme-binding subunit MsrQ [Caulobacter radicis]|uniref:Protein-methionine-sulfoxide reductase heme-binding subunit MsrQ n=1 Tax=Caulobacter radicis TaxID=2172650 RepID=A0A2T9J9K4_9CAUL|nr:protein-methionine-sulfoxide reductase heme-binding subunit MsrQ [Caulobacter radicis]
MQRGRWRAADTQRDGGGEGRSAAPSRAPSTPWGSPSPARGGGARRKRPSKTRDNLVYAAIWLACAAPLAWLAFRAFTGDLGVNPIETLVRQLGVWGLRLLLVGLAITPAAVILKKPRLVRFRRTIGLFAFAYVSLHLFSYIGVDLFFDFRQLVKDILKRPFITLGMAAFALLVPLAVTSTNGWVVRMGRAAWSRLHWLIYVIVPLGVAHYYLLVKADHRPPLVYGAILAVLLGWRVWRKVAAR